MNIRVILQKAFVYNELKCYQIYLLVNNLMHFLCFALNWHKSKMGVGNEEKGWKKIKEMEIKISEEAMYGA